MRLNLDTHNMMIKILTECFNANAMFDNIAYDLESKYLKNIADVIHHKVAHKMPAFADEVSDKMLELGGRPIREALNTYDKEYGEVADVFKDLYEELMYIRKIVLTTIDVADLKGDAEVRIFGENLLEDISLYIKQAEEWKAAISKMSPNDLDIHIADYTHFIK